jgi:hypothetical protein
VGEGELRGVARRGGRNFFKAGKEEPRLPSLFPYRPAKPIAQVAIHDLLKLV